MIESMATGTPVIAMKMGSTPEVIVHGQTGFLCETVEECIAAIAPATQLSRKTCREHVLKSFSVEHMTEGYEAVYQQILADRFIQNGHAYSMSQV
jgi:glycosyltransferase involved in cell wall biosynthesis